MWDFRYPQKISSLTQIIIIKQIIIKCMSCVLISVHLHNIIQFTANAEQLQAEQNED